MTYPHDDGDTVVIGPECFATRDGSVLSWRGENYTPQRPSLRVRLHMTRLARTLERLAGLLSGHTERLDDLADDVARLALRADELGILRPPRTVLWGGRPDVDRQAGSTEDRAHTMALDRVEVLLGGLRQLRAAGERFTSAGSAFFHGDANAIR